MLLDSIFDTNEAAYWLLLISLIKKLNLANVTGSVGPKLQEIWPLQHRLSHSIICCCGQ